MVAPSPLPASRPDTRRIPEPQTTRVSAPKLPTAGPGFWTRKKVTLLSAVAVLTFAAAGLTYWFVLRKPVVHNAPIIEGPPASQPATTAQNPTTEPQPTSQPAQPAQTEPQEAPGEGQNVVSTVPAAPAAAKSARTNPRLPSAPAPEPYEEAHQNAEQALSASRLLEPPENNALFWARRAKSLGDPAADPIEQQVFARQMASVHDAIQAHDYPRAQTQLAQLTSYFPDRPEVQQMGTTIQQEQQKYLQQQEQQRRQEEIEAQTKHFQFRHRHVSLFGPGGNAQYFCSGTLTVLPDGTVNYDCAQTDDPSGRCDHVSFPPGSLKQVKIGLDGRLHLASKGRGNFDFEGDRASIQQAQAAVAPSVQK